MGNLHLVVLPLALVLFVCLNHGPGCFGLDNGLARTPPMGWLNWERYRCNTDCENYPNDCVSEKLFKKVADIFDSDGYKKVGYKYINIDDCWAEKERDENGLLVPDGKRFPSGIKALADYVHAKGLKLGIYGDFGTKTCAGYPGTLFHIEDDTKLFASWMIDSLKLDGCNVDIDLMDEGYPTVGKYMNKTGRHMLYSCSWPAYQVGAGKKPDYEKIAKHCNIWRNYDDIQDDWSSVLGIINYYGDNQKDLIAAAGPGNFNDPDMLIIGDYSLSEDQSQSQFALWAIMAAPLFMSTDLENIKPWQKAILLNSEVIAVNQDPLGKMGQRVIKDDQHQVWVRELVNASLAVVIFSTRDDMPVFMEAPFSEIGWKGSEAHVRDLFQHIDLGVYNGTYKTKVNPWGVSMVLLTRPAQGLRNSVVLPLNEV